MTNAFKIDADCGLMGIVGALIWRSDVGAPEVCRTGSHGYLYCNVQTDHASIWNEYARVKHQVGIPVN